MLRIVGLHESMEENLRAAGPMMEIDLLKGLKTTASELHDIFSRCRKTEIA